MKKSVLMQILLVTSLIVLISCSNNKKEEKQESAIEEVDENSTDQGTNKPPVVEARDLKITNVKIIKLNDPIDSWITHQIKVTIRNTGNAQAKGFSCGVNYKCPGGTTISGGNTIVQGGVLGSNRQFEYLRKVHIHCEPIPAFLDMEFNVDINNDVEETNENNNIYSRRMSIPF
ncbi:hypothetical protein OOZ15_18075 [Galbibacter sp. EGI 63066]|uniref:CARDB domain-containing protein n=1 Tax=Galbibacter sp. EGI 63066 TaxID=2993559 RepID=UPI0022494036|nr:CARDB domain-containing protein [Galbibacter sp. EGI 63066]MCX2681868.1 hypothetical protein [Galbibacter sp. EGI 63066]